MKKNLLKGTLSLALVGASMMSFGQTRYLDEVFTDSQIEVTKDVTYGTNVDIMKHTSLLDPTYLQGNIAQIIQEMTTLKTAYQTGGQIPASFYTPFALDTTTKVKVSDLKMDVYMPKIAEDTLAERPVILYIHTGNFLPPVINGGVGGSKEDSAAVELCKQWAKRGYVAIAANYRHGWNPTATGPTGVIVRRATLLNAVYRAIHDMKQAVRTVRADAAGSNTYAINSSKIAIYGQGSGGYVSVAYNSLNRYAELELPKFLNPLTQSSYVDTTVVGPISGMGGALNMYFDNGQSSEIQACVNAGGALADISWLEGDIEAPMISFHAIRDAFAPFDTGTVIVPTTNEDVVDVNGSNMFIEKAVALGVNDAFKDLPTADDYTAKARSMYGQTYTNIPTININDPVVVASGAEGLFPVDSDMGVGAPWEWWSQSDLTQLVAYVNSITGGSYDANTIHANALLSNPNMSKSQALTYIDTIQGYMNPRIMRAMQIGDWEALSVNEVEVNNVFKAYPNPAKDVVMIEAVSGTIENIVIYDVTGKTVFNQNAFGLKTNVNVSQLKAGVYFVQVRATNGTKMEKLIIE